MIVPSSDVVVTWIRHTLDTAIRRHLVAVVATTARHPADDDDDRGAGVRRRRRPDEGVVVDPCRQVDVIDVVAPQSGRVSADVTRPPSGNVTAAIARASRGQGRGQWTGRQGTGSDAHDRRHGPLTDDGKLPLPYFFAVNLSLQFQIDLN